MERGLNRYRHPYTIQHMYKFYKKKHKGLLPYLVQYDLYSKILRLYFKEIVNQVLEEGSSFKLPCNLGTFQIVKKKMQFSKNLSKGVIDWENSKKYKKLIHHVNFHSDGYKYLYKWDKRNARTINISKYKFEATRDNKRGLAYKIKNKIRDYFEN